MGALGEGPGGAVAGYLARHALEAVNGWVAAGAGWLLSHAGRALGASSRPELGAAFFTSHYRVMLELAAVVAVPLLLVSALQAVVRQDAGQLVRSAFVYLPLGLLLGAVAVELVRLGVAAVDDLSTTLARGTGLDARHFLDGLVPLGRLAALTGSGALPAFVTFALLLILALGALLLWLELVVRSAAIEVAVLFVPLALAGLVWPPTAAWARRLAETLGALVVAKLVIVAVLVLAAAALLRPGRGAGPAAVVEGTALLGLAVASPFALLRLVPVVEAGSVAHLEGSGRQLGRRAASALARPARLAAPALLGGAGLADAAWEPPVGATGTGLSDTVVLPWADAPRGWELPPDLFAESGSPGPPRNEGSASGGPAPGASASGDPAPGASASGDPAPGGSASPAPASEGPADGSPASSGPTAPGAGSPGGGPGPGPGRRESHRRPEPGELRREETGQDEGREEGRGPGW